MTILALMLSFAKIGLLGFGGGYAMIPLIQKEVSRFGISGREFIEVLALSQVTPGPLGINTATYAGFKVAGLAGALAATLSNVLPTFVLMLGVAALFYRFRANRHVQVFFKRMRPLFVGLICAAALGMMRDIRLWGDYKAIGIFLVSLVVLYRYRISPVVLVLGAGLLGLLLY